MMMMSKISSGRKQKTHLYIYNSQNCPNNHKDSSHGTMGLPTPHHSPNKKITAPQLPTITTIPTLSHFQTRISYPVAYLTSLPPSSKNNRNKNRASQTPSSSSRTVSMKMTNC